MRLVRDRQDMHQCHPLQGTVPWPSSLHPGAPMDIPGGENPVPCAQPCSCRAGEAKPGTGAQSNAEGITLGVLGACLGCMNPKHTEGSSGDRGRPKEEGVHPSVQQDCAIPRNHQAQDVPPCRRTLCPGTDGLDVPTLCCCWERDKHWFGCTVVVRKGEKASLQGTGGLSLQECAVSDWALPQLLCGMAAGSGGSVGQQCHPALPKSPFCCFPMGLGMLQLTRAGRALGATHPLAHP